MDPESAFIIKYSTISSKPYGQPPNICFFWRPRTLSDTLVSSTLDAALGAAAAASAGTDANSSEALGAVASWATRQREKLRLESEQQEKFNRLSLFQSDLELLGISLTEESAARLDERVLRKAFRARSRQLHPDAQLQQTPDERSNVPSVYELNAAYEAVRRLL